MTSQGQPVRFRDCQCPGSPHNGEDGADDGDIVYMRDHLGFVAGAEAARAMMEAMRHVDFLGWVPTDKGRIPERVQNQLNELSFTHLAPIYLREGPLGWNLVDENGPVPCTKEALLDLPYSSGLAIGQKGDDLYSDEVASPLVRRTNELSRNGQTGKPTRPTIRSSSARPSRLKPSSRNGSAGRPSPVSR